MMKTAIIIDIEKSLSEMMNKVFVLSSYKKEKRETKFKKNKQNQRLLHCLINRITGSHVKLKFEV